MGGGEEGAGVGGGGRGCRYESLKVKQVLFCHLGNSVNNFLQ